MGEQKSRSGQVRSGQGVKFWKKKPKKELKSLAAIAKVRGIILTFQVMQGEVEITPRVH